MSENRGHLEGGRINLESLAQVIYASAITFRDEGHYKLISLDFKTEFIVDGQRVLHDGNNNKYVSKSDIVGVISKRLEEYLGEEGSDEILFIRFDEMTRAVMVVTKNIIRRIKAPDADLTLGMLVMEYFRTWYFRKCGNDPMLITANHVQNFSKNELRIIDEDLIPIAVAPVGMPIFKRVIDDAIMVSPLKDYVVASKGYDVYGKPREVKMWWIPRTVAKEYLEEPDLFKVLSERVLYTLLNNAGFLGIPAQQDNRKIDLNSSSAEQIATKTNEYIKEKLLARNTKDLEITQLSEEQIIEDIVSQIATPREGDAQDLELLISDDIEVMDKLDLGEIKATKRR